MRESSSSSQRRRHETASTFSCARTDCKPHESKANEEEIVHQKSVDALLRAQRSGSERWSFRRGPKPDLSRDMKRHTIVAHTFHPSAPSAGAAAWLLALALAACLASWTTFLAFSLGVGADSRVSESDVEVHVSFS